MNSEQLFYYSRDNAAELKQSYIQYVFGFPIYNIIDANDAELVLNDNNLISKGDMYRFLQPFLKSGLLTSTGQHWHGRRKLLTPAFHFKILEQFLEVFKQESVKVINILQRAADNTVGPCEINLNDVIPRFTLNSICETALGVKLDDCSDGDEYRNNITIAEHSFIKRVINPLMSSDALYNRYGDGLKDIPTLKKLHSFSSSIIEKRRQNFIDHSLKEGNDLESRELNTKQRYAMLDTMLLAEKEGLIDHAGICEEVDTFMFEGFDTTSMNIILTLAYLANHPQKQQRCVEEITELIPNKDNLKDLDNRTLAQLKYLECVIKETQRICPSVPGFMRECHEETQLANNLILPKGTQIIVHIFDIHRNPRYFNQPNEFIPERFLPENSVQRHPFAFIPFSAGRRNLHQMRARFFLVPPHRFVKSATFQKLNCLRMAGINSNTAHKINNSYDSEPSTGSGSSLSENNEGQISDEENMNLPYLLKPKTLSTDNANNNTKLSLQGSQESQFRGFVDSPYGQVNKRLYGSQLENLKLPEIDKKTEKEKEEQQTVSGKQKSPGMIAFPRFYESIMEENSCNAVDMPATSAEAAKATTDSLSFDGKIKSLTEAPSNSSLSTVQESFQNASQQQQQPPQQLSESFILHRMNSERSPDLFADSDEDDGDDQTDKGLGTTLEDLPEALEESQCVSEAPSTSHNASGARYSLTVPTESSFVDDQTQDTQLTSSDPRTHFIENCRRERELYRRIRRCLQGVRPPPTVTTPDTDVIHAVVNMKSKVINFLVCKDADADTIPASSIEDSGICATSSLLKPTHSLAEAQNMSWRDILGVRQHGLRYNLNKAAEQNEYLSLSVVERYVGAETATSYVRSPSSAKKRNMRMKMLTQSPGNRLSHLAKRRAIFSSANLATNSIKLNSSIGPQILLDKKKERNKRKATPKRKTPGSKKIARKTPSSSARKRLFRTDLIKPGPSRETSKRALFQSPAKSSQQQQLFPPKPLFKPEIANRVERSKRALFSPEQNTPSNQLESLLKRKRNARDDEDAAELASQSSKLFRACSAFGSGLTPRALKIKSQSFCIGAGSSTASQQNVAANMQQSPFANTPRLGHGLSGSSSTLACSTTPTISKLQRAHSEMSATPQSAMTDNQRKKLLWAVSQALQEKKISVKHENFRQHAADLARIVKRIFQEFYLGHTTSNSETLLRLAKKYAFSVIAGKQPDDIYLHARSHESETKLQSSSRLSGYIGPEEFAQRKLLLSQSSSQSLSQMSLARSKADGSMPNLFGSENSIDSFGFSQMSQGAVTSNSATQSSLMERISEDLFSKQQQLPILPNPTLQNSSSKSNLGGLALRENVHCEQRRSAQKNFTGKDQRNISPYYNGGNSNGSGRKLQSTTAVPSVDSSAKARRQISFDS
ncbi:hypothetical protein ACLKA6_007741 [Drosophila palustris]